MSAVLEKGSLAAKHRGGAQKTPSGGKSELERKQVRLAKYCRKYCDRAGFGRCAGLGVAQRPCSGLRPRDRRHRNMHRNWPAGAKEIIAKLKRLIS